MARRGRAGADVRGGWRLRLVCAKRFAATCLGGTGYLYYITNYYDAHRVDHY